jgi:hypothetical protein
MTSAARFSLSDIQTQADFRNESAKHARHHRYWKGVSVASIRGVA